MAEGEGTPTSTQTDNRDYSWPFWPLVPLYPYGKRRTIRKEIVKDKIWTFDQLQGIFYVIVPVRMTVIKLESQGLLVYAPVAPTRECIRLLNELVAEHGEVKYILLTTGSGIEHKVFVGPFARCFPAAQVFVAPQQWSFPLTLLDLKVRGFLIQRLTFKCCVLSAILRPFNRRTLPINEPDSQPSQRVCLQKRTRIFI